ncbi:MAG: MIP/aquaporin family protein [Gemmatimonadales bacterium]
MTGVWRRGEMVRRTLVEAIGTFLLVLIGPGAMMVNRVTDGAITHLGVALAFGAVVSVVVYSIGPISGAHINPAVTVALWSGGRFPARAVAPYVAAQCVGAAAGAFLLAVGLGISARYGATLPSVSVPVAFGVELLLSAFLMLTVMAASRLPSTALVAPLQLGTTVGVCALVGGPLTGASMNPARSFGPALASGAWEVHWLYWLAPMIAMVGVVHLWRFSSAGGVAHTVGADG